MKTIASINKRFGMLAMGALLSLPVFFTSCKKDNAYEDMRPNAIVTVRHADENNFYLQLDEQTKLWPINNPRHPYGDKVVRAFVRYKEVDFPEGVDKNVYSKAVEIRQIDSILTKKPVVTEGLESDIEKYGENSVEIFNDWMTNVEDGFLTLHYVTYWGNTGIKHFVNLVTGTNPEDPYEVVFRQNSFEDTPVYQGDAIVAFDLSELPDTQGKTVKLTLKFDSYSGQKTAKFDYCTRKD